MRCEIPINKTIPRIERVPDPFQFHDRGQWNRGLERDDLMTLVSRVMDLEKSKSSRRCPVGEQHAGPTRLRSLHRWRHHELDLGVTIM